MNSEMTVLNEYNDCDTVELYRDFTENIGLLNIEKFLVKKYVNTEDKILDVGCGSGRATFGLYKMGYKKIVGIDVCENMINQALKISKIKKSEIDFINQDIRDLKDENFDLVCFWFNGLMVNPTYKARQEIVKSIIEHVIRGGYFIFTTPMLPDDYEFEEEYKIYQNSDCTFGFELGDRIYDKNYYIHFPSDKEILSLCQDLYLTEQGVCESVCPQKGRGYSLSYRTKYWVFRR